MLIDGAEDFHWSVLASHRAMKQVSLNTISVTPVQKSNPKDILVETHFKKIKPLLLLLRAFGRLPYSFNDEGLLPFKIVSFPVFYTAISFIAQLLWTYYAFCYLYREKISKSESYDQTLYFVSIALILVLNITVPFTYWYAAQKIANYVVLWKKFQEDNRHLDLKYSKLLSVKVFAVLIVPAVLITLAIEKYLLAEQTVMVFVPYVSAMCSSGITIMMWFTSLHELRSLAKQLLSKIIVNGCRDISSHRRTWLSLSGLVSATGYTHGHTGLALCSVLFSTFVLSMYALLAFLVEFKETSFIFWGLAGRSLIAAVLIFVFCDTAHRTTQEVGSDFSSKILTVDVSHLKESELAEVSLLLQAMSTNPPVLDCEGFVKINRSHFVSFISNSVTYLIVLIQFKASAPQTSFGNNTTIMSQ